MNPSDHWVIRRLPLIRRRDTCIYLSGSSIFPHFSQTIWNITFLAIYLYSKNILLCLKRRALLRSAFLLHWSVYKYRTYLQCQQSIVFLSESPNTGGFTPQMASSCPSQGNRVTRTGSDGCFLRGGLLHSRLWGTFRLLLFDILLEKSWEVSRVPLQHWNSLWGHYGQPSDQLAMESGHRWQAGVLK